MTYYWYGHFDAAHFQSHAEAIRIVAPIEDIFMDGKPLADLACSHDIQKVCGMGLEPAGKQEQAVLVSNYQGVPVGTRVTVQTTAEPGTPVTDLHTGERLGEIKADDSFAVALDAYAAHLHYVGRKYQNEIGR